LSGGLHGEQAPSHKTFVPRDAIQRFVQGDFIMTGQQPGAAFQLKDRSGKFHQRPLSRAGNASLLMRTLEQMVR
jgi:hypothetical protein